MNSYVITLARGLGSGGSHIAGRLSRELGIPSYDEEILRMASELSGINEAYFFEANEKIKKGQLAIKSSKGVYNSTLYKLGDRQYLSNENLFNYQAVILKNIALEEKQSCVIIGKAANFVIGGLKNVVRVNIQAPMEHCVKNIMERLQKNEKEAREIIQKTDKYRRDYYKYYTGGNWNDPKEYDLCINTGALGEEYATELIIRLLRDRGFIGQET